MKQKYERPVVRDLGDPLLSAEGVCFNGSIATGAPGAHCIPYGGAASGAWCGFGYIPNETACRMGGTPTAHGCLDGLEAAIECSQGSSPV
jgi:hypothetical protein